MKPHAVQIEERGTLISEESAPMGVDQDSLPHIMHTLTNAYPDPPKAVLRELATNGYDAQIECGVTDPVEIFLPIYGAQQLTVKDRGCGMTKDEILYHYSQYGASTKRGTNKQTGTLGIGSKSPLAIANAFTIESVKDGWKTMAMMVRTPEGGGKVDIVSHMPTDEHSGTSITVPVPVSHDLARKARNLFQYWPEGSILIDGKAPERVQGDWMGTKICLRDPGHPDVIVMGNIAYPVPEELPGMYPTDNMGRKIKSVVAFVKMAAVQFTPDRESLMLTELTTSTVKGLKDEIATRIAKLAEKEIGGAVSHHEAVKALRSWKYKYRFVPAGVLYKGEVIPTSWDSGTVYDASPYTRKKYSRVHGEAALTWNGTIVVNAPLLGDGLTMPAQIATKQWIGTTDHQSVLMFEKHPDPKWLHDLKVIDFQEVLDTAKEVRKNRVGSFKVRDGFGHSARRGYTPTEMDVFDLDLSLPTVYCIIKEVDEYRYALQMVREYLYDQQIRPQPTPLEKSMNFIAITPAKEKKLLKTVPGVIHAADLIQRIVTEAGTDALGTLEGRTSMKLLKVGYYERALMRKMDHATVIDPELQALIKQSKEEEKKQEIPANVRFYENLKQCLSYRLRSLIKFVELPDLSDEIVEINPWEAYPLVEHLSTYNFGNGDRAIEHLTLYLNSAYLLRSSVEEEVVAP